MKAKEAVIRTIVSGVPLCGCGSHGRNWRIVREMLERSHRIFDAATSGTNRESFYEAMPVVDLSATAVEFISQVLGECRHPLLEHGTGTGFSWLTPAGKVLLAFLREHEDADAWPGFATEAEEGEPFGLGRDELAAAIKGLP